MFLNPFTSGNHIAFSFVGSLVSMLVRFIQLHVASKLAHFLTIEYFTVSILLMDIRGCFYFELPIKFICLRYMYSSFLDTHISSGAAELRVDVCFNINRYLPNISQVVEPIYTPISRLWEILLLHTHTNIWYCWYLNICCSYQWRGILLWF